MLAAGCGSLLITYMGACVIGTDPYSAGIHEMIWRLSAGCGNSLNSYGCLYAEGLLPGTYSLVARAGSYVMLPTCSGSSLATWSYRRMTYARGYTLRAHERDVTGVRQRTDGVR